MPDYEHECHCPVCNVNLKCGSGGRNNIQKHKENSKTVSSKLAIYILILTLSLALLLYRFEREKTLGNRLIMIMIYSLNHIFCGPIW